MAYTVRICPVCHGEFIPHNGFQKYCTKECFHTARKSQKVERYKKPEVRAKRLAYQKEYYSRPDVKARSDEYNRNWVKTHKKRTSEIKKKYKLSEKGKASESRYMEGAAYKAARHRKDVKRRFRKNNNGSLKIDSGIHWTALVDRTGSIKCTICGRICNPDSNDKGLHPTVDHIIPLYSGGTHTWDNVCLLCMRCNSLKGHKRTLDDVKSILASQQGAM